MEDIKENIPIYIRVSEGIKDHILSGDIEEGSQLMSTTKLAKLCNANIATVTKGVNLLVSQEIVQKKKGIGMFVVKGAVEKLKKERRKVFKEKYMTEMIREAIRLGYTPEDLQKMAEEVGKRVVEEKDN